MQIRIIVIRFECADSKIENISSFLESIYLSDAMWLRKIYFDIYTIELFIYWSALVVVLFSPSEVSHTSSYMLNGTP